MADKALPDRLQALDWAAIEQDLGARGWTHHPSLLTPEECREVVDLFADQKRFRSTVVMERHQYGVGLYRYFRYPLPDLVQTLREAAYSYLAPIANRWREKVSRADPFPASHAELLERCRAAGQTKPTPLILYYEEGGYNNPHRDLYGKIAFPLQLVVVLSRRATVGDPGNFAGGEFLFIEEPRGGPPRSHEVAASQGDLVIFGTQYRPEPVGQRWRQLPVRHGARTVTAGRRYALGIIFHDGR